MKMVVNPAPQLKKHLPELDGLRGVAIIGVMLFHFLQHLPTGTSLAGIIVKCSRLGQTGVDLFFVLSGFLITGILLDSRGGSNYFRNFYARRTLRIFPLYYFSLGLFFFVITPFLGYAIPPVREQMWAWGYLVNIPSTFFPSTPIRVPGHFWSLAVEEHFYLIWPLIVWTVAPRRLAMICLSLIPLALVCRLLLHSNGFPTFFFTLCRTDSLAIGALVAILFRHRRPTGPIIFAALAILLGICFPLWIATGGRGIPLITMMKGTMIAIIYALLLMTVVISAEHSLLKRVFTVRVLRFFGQYSYALYVFHGMIPRPWRWDEFRAIVPDDIMAMVVMCLTYGGVSVIAALLSWHVLEKRFLRLKRYFEYNSSDTRFVSAPELVETLKTEVSPVSVPQKV